MKIKTSKLGIIEANNFKELIEILTQNNISKNATINFIDFEYSNTTFSSLLYDYNFGLIK
jgi:hypothetical protein